jgi:hypothetical protein
MARRTAALTTQNKMTIIMVMAKKQPFTLVYADEVKLHLRAVEPKYHSAIRSEIEFQLLYEPDVETRNRKPLNGPFPSGRTGNCVSGRKTVSACSTRSTPRAETSVSWQSASKSGTGYSSGERRLSDENCIGRRREGTIERVLERE